MIGAATIGAGVAGATDAEISGAIDAGSGVEGALTTGATVGYSFGVELIKSLE